MKRVPFRIGYKLQFANLDIYKTVILCLIVWSCGNEQVDTETINDPENVEELILPENERTLSYGKTNIEEITAVKKNLEKLTGTSSGTNKGLSYRRGVIDLNTIEWVIDNTREQTNYTFPIYVEGASEQEFYNLIVTVEKDGEVTDPYVRRYVVADHALEEYRASGYEFGKFQGKFFTYDFYDFFDSLEFDSKGKSTVKPPICDDDGSTIGSASGSPIENPFLIQDGWFQVWGPETTIPTGSISFSSLWESYTAYTASSYQNSQNSTEYEETVETSSQGVVFLGYQNPTAPYVTYTNTTYTSFSVTTNYANDATGFVLGADICTAGVNITIQFSDGGSITISYGANCQATAPVNKSNVGSTAKPDCDDGPTQVVAINKRTYANIFNRLCPDANSVSFLDLIANEANATALNNYLNTHNVQCDDDSKEKAFALEAMIAWSQGDAVDFDDEIILHQSILSNTQVKCVFDKLKSQSSTFFKKVIDSRFGGSKIANIRYRIADTPDGEDAFTKGRVNGSTLRNYEILLDPTAVASASNIEIALMLIHESIHAELQDRLVEMGIIIGFNNNGSPIFANSDISYDEKIDLTAIMRGLYKSNASSNPQWLHNLFNTEGLRLEMAHNLLEIHPLINDSANDFVTNVNGLNNVLYNNLTLQELMEFISWIGLEGTDEYNNTIRNNPYLLGKMSFIEAAAKNEYSKNCN